MRKVRFTHQQLREGIKLNLGCGHDRPHGFVGLDKVDLGQEIVWNLEEGIPLPDNSVIEVRCVHVLEHIKNLIPLMNEIYRVCKDGATIYIEVPHSETPQAWQDPTHVRAFNEYSWDYCQKGHLDYLRKIYGIRANFEKVSMERDGWQLKVTLRARKNQG